MERTNKRWFKPIYWILKNVATIGSIGGGIVFIDQILKLIFPFYKNSIRTGIIEALSISINIKFQYKTILILLFLTSIFLLIRRKCVRAGVNKIHLKFPLYIRRFNPKMHIRTLKLIHKFEHVFLKCSNRIIKEKIISPFSPEGDELTEELLQAAHNILRMNTGIDLSINIKLFVDDEINQQTSPFKNLDNILIKTYKRIPSKQEEEKCFNKEKKTRSNDELFKVFDCKVGTKEEIVSYYKIHKNELKQYKYNSAYEYVLGPTIHYWLSNNLAVDKKNGIFESSSNDYEQYYKSLGVFLISSNIDMGKHVNPKSVVGLLIIDSIECNVFDDLSVRTTGGYLAHRFYEYFLLYPRFKDIIS